MRVKPSLHDVLARHEDHGQLLKRSRKQRDVVSHRGWQDATPRQLEFIAALARELGCPVPKVKTKQGASRSIDALAKRKEAQGRR